MNKKISIAIDGPAAAGKSTIAQMIAKELSYTYIDTGAMYRALTYESLKHQIDPTDEQSLVRLFQQITIDLKSYHHGQKVFVNGKDVTPYIRTEEVTQVVSLIAKHPAVRNMMVERLKKISRSGGVIMDGRDIGTFVLPHAELKIFLNASVEERAKRRHLENIKRGQSSDLDQIKREIKKRDQMDSERETAPLAKAEDAIEIDTTSLTIRQVVEQILQYAQKKI